MVESMNYVKKIKLQNSKLDPDRMAACWKYPQRKGIPKQTLYKMCQYCY